MPQPYTGAPCWAFSPAFPTSQASTHSWQHPALQRREQPYRQRVGIAGAQTGILSSVQPGGWNIIGRTPLTMFDPSCQQPVLVQAGDSIVFSPISVHEFETQQSHEFTCYPQICDIRESERAGCDVLEPGMLTVVQDDGRRGLQHAGVPVSGAMDRQALALGNILVGNGEGTAALEMTLSGPCLAVTADALVAVTGADMGLQVDGRDAPAWTAVLVRSGSIISMTGCADTGCRAWLCVAGGIDVPSVLGSHSTLLRSALGGFRGRPLNTGDHLLFRTLNPWDRRLDGFSCPTELRPSYSSDAPVPTLPGPQIHSLTPMAQQAFLSAAWIVGDASDRMGCRLEGPRLDVVDGADVISEVVPEGAVEIVGSGLPIIMLADHQTTGGYSSRLSSLRPHSGGWRSAARVTASTFACAPLMTRKRCFGSSRLQEGN